MNHRSLKMILAAEILVVIVALFLIGNHYAAAQKLPLYPAEDQEYLDYFEYGVQKTIDFEDLKFIYENTYKDKKVTCTGSIAFQPGVEVYAMKIEYVITNKKREIVRTVKLLEANEHKAKYEFKVTFPFQGDYELGAIHINVIDIERIETEGEKLNV